ncbi:MAG: hypothetical protein ICV64_05635 [Thermoleophilia bacterium]|nr:hypothetical protein [Thermoleophilia bacterium]
MLFTGTAVAAGSAQRAADARAIYSAFDLNARESPRTTRCGAYTVTRATYTGRASSPDPRLAGRVTYVGRVVTNGRGAGFASGSLTFRDRRNRIRMRGTLRAVVSQGNSVHGIVTGRLRRPNALLLANISLFFHPNYSFAGVRLGLQTAPNSAVAYSALGRCG